MSMTDAQIAAFQNAAGFAPQSSSTLWLSLVLVLTLLWCTRDVDGLPNMRPA
jgi:integrating conjugative element protein (TIGR03758 family)